MTIEPSAARSVEGPGDGPLEVFKLPPSHSFASLRCSLTPCPGEAVAGPAETLTALDSYSCAPPPRSGVGRPLGTPAPPETTQTPDG